jgi:hypothetical protein
VDCGLKNCSKKVKKNVDARVAFWDIGLTHGNNRTTTLNKMRTKTLLLTAAALLAAGIVSSQAQPVYSQNIVGYASVATTNAGVNYLITIPFVIGVSNGANEVFGSTLPSGTSLLLWNGAGYTTYIYDTSVPNPAFPSVVWYKVDDFTPAVIPTLPVGQGFFLNPYLPNLVNTFAGTVAVNVGTSNQIKMPNGGVNYLVGSLVPYAGAVTNGNNSTGGPNLNNLPSGTTVLVWNGAGYTTYIYDTSVPNPSFPTAVWYKVDDFTPTTAPTISVGQGFFVNPYTPYVWTTGL